MPPIDFDRKIVHRFRNPPGNERELVREFFGNSTSGVFVDVGANDPVAGSQSHHLEQSGWHGLLIEPLPDYCRKLREQRTARVVECACSGPENHGKHIEFLVAGVYSTLNSATVLGQPAVDGKISVHCRTLDSILEECQIEPGFDFLSIDIEGHEMEMFKGFSLKRWKPRLVLIEDHVLDHRKHNHLAREGYQILMRTGINSWYVPVESGFNLSLPSRLQFFRKFWLGTIFRRMKYSV